MWTVSRPLIPQPEVPPSPTATLVCNVSARLAYLPWNLRSRVALSCVWDYMYIPHVVRTCGLPVFHTACQPAPSARLCRSPGAVPRSGRRAGLLRARISSATSMAPSSSGLASAAPTWSAEVPKQAPAVGPVLVLVPTLASRPSLRLCRAPPLSFHSLPISPAGRSV